VRPKLVILKRSDGNIETSDITLCDWNQVREGNVQIELAGHLFGTPRIEGSGKCLDLWALNKILLIAEHPVSFLALCNPLITGNSCGIWS
jgi:hypothetical protein